MKLVSATIKPGFWQEWITVNHQSAIEHQWAQLEASGCIDNFRIAAGLMDGFRQGWFFADSDAHKWLDAAARILRTQDIPALRERVESFISLLEAAQAEDGYLFTYNQIHFPGQRWINLQIEHELYCHGHLIEAGVSHYEATGSERLLMVACKAADRIVSDFLGKGPRHTPGHEEIEIALLRLYQVTRQASYLEMAGQFLNQRGRDPLFGVSVIRQFLSVGRRTQTVATQRVDFANQHQMILENRVPPGNAAKKPWNAVLRWYLGALTGQYFQQHHPLQRQTTPVGHSVRFTYLMTAAVMMERLTGTRAFLPTLEQAWQRMVQRRMYITGGIGSLPEMEGFGRDYELDPEVAYAETCAALGSIFWNWEMAQTTAKAAYSDLLEWQLYNAALVGMGQNGLCYLYNNPLASRGGIERRAWYAIPCCPSNISRFLASLDQIIASADQDQVWIHQYISSQVVLSNTANGDSLHIEIDSRLPWDGRAFLRVHLESRANFTLKLRNPSWSATTRVSLNGSVIEEIQNPIHDRLDPNRSDWITLERTWQAGDQVELAFDIAPRLLHAHPRVKGHHGKAAVARGPLVYCLESTDQPQEDIFSLELDTSSLQPVWDEGLLGGICAIHAKSTRNHPLILIPYHLWANRGEARMTVWVNATTKTKGAKHENPLDA